MKIIGTEITAKSDTIAAIATPRGIGGIAVIRISGSGAFAVGEKIFRHKKNKNKNFAGFCDIPSNTAVFGDIADAHNPDRIIDEGIAVKFKSPQSYTGEDTVEISCHGGVYITKAVLKSAINAGARLAAPGEFTKRAYINGKISLTGAEAVGRLISAVNETGARVARAQSKGGLSRKIAGISDRIKQIISEVYVYIDYPGEDLADMTVDVMTGKLSDITEELENLRKSYEIGGVISDGINCAIIGKPNTGKSTLLNLLSLNDVAIVHDTPGTTRDIITSRVNLGGFMLNLHDTAGIRSAGGEIESIGIEKARAKIKECGLIIGVFDINNCFVNNDYNDYNILEILNQEKNNGKKIIIILNKCDKFDESNITETKKIAPFNDFNPKPLIISAKNNIVLNSDKPAYELIKDCIENLYNLDGYDLDSGEILTEERQYFEVCEACVNLNSAVGSLKNGFTQDIAGMDLELAVKNLERCDSKAVSEDIVDMIFKNFCVGK